MATGWLEAIEEKERAQRAQEFSVVKAESRPRKMGPRPVMLAGAGLSMVAIAVIAGVVTVKLLVDEQPTSTAANQSEGSTTAAAVSAPPAAVAVAGSKCMPQVGQIAPEKGSLRAAVAAFENAYFSHDLDGVKSVFADDSPLAKQDWEAVFGESVPENSEWCVHIDPVNKNQVAMTLEMTPPGGEKDVFEQRVTGVRDATGWRIQKIEPKE